MSQRTRPPLPAPLEPFDIHHPALPRGESGRNAAPISPGSIHPTSTYTASTRADLTPLGPTGLPVMEPSGLDGLRILHLSDLHIRRLPTWSDRLRTLCDALGALAAAPPHIVAITGDSMDAPGDEHAAMRALRAVLDACPAPALGTFGIFGNHDSARFATLVQRELPRVHWLRNRTARLRIGLRTLDIVGLSWPEDVLSAVMQPPILLDANTLEPRADAGTFDAPDFSIALAHMPNAIFPASELGLPLVLAGHTHGGQIRLSPRLAPHTSSDVPSHLASGVLRWRSTLCCISRGLGDGIATGLRFNCPWQAPLYTLRHGALPEAVSGRASGGDTLPGLPVDDTVERAGATTVRQVMAW